MDGVRNTFLIVGALFVSVSTANHISSGTQCYPHIGCFSNRPPFNNANGALPLSPEFIQTTFYLFTREHQTHADVLQSRNLTSLHASKYRDDRETVIIVHGFLQNGLVDWTINMANEILKRGPTNVIIVDWGHGSGFPYTQAVANTRVVGAEVADLVTFLTDNTRTTVSRFHILGHSLGAHISGYAGARLPGLRRVTGLDPAQPNFDGYDVQVRVDPSDANFVDVIHTDASNFDTISGYGMRQPVGHIDFYPNGGLNQPGCPRESWIGILDQEYTFGSERTADYIACSHSRSIEYFTESINSGCKFKAFPCQNNADFNSGRCLSCGNRPCPAMGYDADKYKARGKHYLATGSHQPFCGHQYLIGFQLGPDMVHAYGRIKLRLLGSNGLSDDVYIDGRQTGFRPNEEHHAMIVSHTDLGNIVQVQITFTEQRSIFWWGSAGHITIHHVRVQPTRRNKPWFFCGFNRVIEAGQRTGLHDPSRHFQSCNRNAPHV